MVQIEHLSDTTFRVTVDKGVTTSHEVHVSEDYLYRLTRDKVTAEELVRASFDFLLERESNASILRNFDLANIGLYFPEFEAEIKKRLGLS